MSLDRIVGMDIAEDITTKVPEISFLAYFAKFIKHNS